MGRDRATEAPSAGGPRLEVIYDASCAFCTAQARRLVGHLGDGAALVPSDSPSIGADPAIAARAARALVVRDAAGQEWDGADAVARLLRATPRWSFAGRAMAWPVVRPLAWLGYRVVARLRHRLPGSTKHATTG